MQYMLLIYEAEADVPALDTPEWGQLMQGYMAFTEDVREKGLLVAGDALEKVGTATTVRVRDGKTETQDGPFAETKEVLAGYYLLDCKDLDEAIDYAAKIPTSKFGSIEIRPVKIFD